MFLIVLGYIICLHGVFSMLNLAAFLAVPKLNQVWRDWRGHGRKFASNPRLSELTAIYEELAVARLRMGLEAFESRWLASVELTHHDHVIWCMSWLHDIVYDYCDLCWCVVTVRLSLVLLIQYRTKATKKNCVQKRCPTLHMKFNSFICNLDVSMFVSWSSAVPMFISLQGILSGTAVTQPARRRWAGRSARVKAGRHSCQRLRRLHQLLQSLHLWLQWVGHHNSAEAMEFINMNCPKKSADP